MFLQTGIDSSRVSRYQPKKKLFPSPQQLAVSAEIISAEKFPGVLCLIYKTVWSIQKTAITRTKERFCASYMCQFQP